MANFTELDRYLFGQATHYDIYRKLGAHFAEVKGVKGVYFDLWAPNAERVFLIGSFNGWNETANEMTRLKPETMGIYELFIPGLKEGELYKYLIETKDGKRLYKADPYANYAELRPGTASAIADIEHFKWTDSKWMENRKKKRMCMHSRWQSTRFIRAPGNVIRAGMMKDLQLQGSRNLSDPICKRNGVHTH